MAKNSEEKKHITRISAKPSTNSKVDAPAEPTKATAKPEKKQPKAAQKTAKKSTEKPVKKSTEAKDGRKPIKEVKLFARPFVALGRYIHDSWQELRLVRWPDRKATWKMTLAVLVYCTIMMVFILLLDALFTFLFNLAFK